MARVLETPRLSSLSVVVHLGAGVLERRAAQPSDAADRFRAGFRPLFRGR